MELTNLVSIILLDVSLGDNINKAGVHKAHLAHKNRVFDARPIQQEFGSNNNNKMVQRLKGY